MPKFLSIVLIATTLLWGQTQYLDLAKAQTCAGTSCKQPRLEFVPGQKINIQVVNQTSSLIELQKLYGSDSIPLRPGQAFNFEGVGTEPNVSVVFWDVTALPLQSRVSKPDAQTLRIELRPGGRPPGDRSIYIQDDGQVSVF